MMSNIVFTTVLPEILLLCGACAVLIGDLFLSDARRHLSFWLTQLVLGGFPLGKVLTHQLSIDDFQKGFELMEAGKAGKVVLSWN